jgi:hypothetical protein
MRLVENDDQSHRYSLSDISGLRGSRACIVWRVCAYEEVMGGHAELESEMNKRVSDV